MSLLNVPYVIGDSMAQITKILDCKSCGSECILSYEPEFGEPIFCPFCAEEMIDEDELDIYERDDEEEEDYYENESPIDEMIMEMDVD